MALALSNGFTFNGRRSTDFLIVNDKPRAILAPITTKLLNTPGRPGAYDAGRKIGVRTFKIDVTITGESQADYLAIKQDIAAWLLTEQPAELVFDDEPEIMYYARLDGSTDINEIARFGTGSITFVCADPYKYGATHNQLIHDPNGDPSANPVMTNNGTAEAFPTFKATILKPTTFLQLVSANNYMQIGRPVAYEETEKMRLEPILTDRMETLSGWVATDVISYGHISGTMDANGHYLYPSSFGSAIDPPNWQGPALKKSLSEPLQDFQAKAWINFRNKGTYSGGLLEVYLLDASNNIVCTMHLKDKWKSMAQIEAQANLGGTGPQIAQWTLSHDYNDFGDDLSGKISIQRLGDEWTFEVIDSAGTLTFTQKGDPGFDQEVTQIQIAMRTWNSDKNPVDMDIWNLRVWKINDVNEAVEVPYIVEADDEIIFDHQHKKILKNGEPFMWPKAFGASFFPIQPGDTELAIWPDDVAIINATWNDRYL